MKLPMLLVLAACRGPGGDTSPSDGDTSPSTPPDGSVNYTGDVEPFGQLGSTAWIEERVEAYGNVYVQHHLVASNRPRLCAAAQEAAAGINEAFTDFSRIYDASTDAYSYEELCVLVQELTAAYGEALDPFQSAGSQIIALDAQYPDTDPDDPPPAGSYTAVPGAEGWDYEGPQLFSDLLRFAKNPFATAAARIDCEADPYSWMDEFAMAENYTWWSDVEEGTLDLQREGETYAVELEGTARAFGTADSSVQDEPTFRVEAQFEAEHCIVDLPNADLYLFEPPFW